MDLTVIIVNWNTRHDLARALRAVQAGLSAAAFSWQIVVVDCASTDGSAEMVRREFPGTSLISLPENRGFAAGANAGLAFSPRSGGQASLLLNADAAVERPAIPTMLDYLASHPDVGVVGPQLRYPDGVVQSSRRRFPTLGTLLWESTPLEQLWPGNPWARRYRMADRPDDVEQDVDWLVGACLLVRDEAVAQAGLLEERFFLYFEELEWLRRIRGAGWRVVYLPAARVWHHEGRSSEQVPLQRHLHFQRSKVRYARLALGPARAALVRAFLLAAYGGQALVEGAKWLLGHRRSLRQERMRIYAAVLRDGLRPVETASAGPAVTSPGSCPDP